MHRLLILLVLILATLANTQAQTFPRSRPNEQGEPTKVWVSLYILDIEKIDSKEQSFTLDVVIKLNWKDARLSGSKGPVPLGAIWQPNVQILNLRNVDTRFAEEVTILNDGMVQYTQRYYATLSSHLNFKDFPLTINFSLQFL